MSGHKKIFDILSEAGVPSLLRRRAPVLQDRRGTFWVVGHHQDDRVKVTERTKKILFIDIKQVEHKQ
jgi:hypothetical protein